jgi:hypothetical protein
MLTPPDTSNATTAIATLDLFTIITSPHAQDNSPPASRYLPEVWGDDDAGQS